MDLLTIYDFGVRFLEKHPRISEWHNRLKKSIIQAHTKENLIRLCQKRRENKSVDAVKCSIALQYCLALLFLFLGCQQFILNFSLFGLVLNIIISFIFYRLGVLNTESLKYSNSSHDERPLEVKTVEVKSVEIKPDDKPKPEKKEKSLFWRIYGYINTLCIWGWIYFSLAHPKALKEWLIESKIMSFIPHEEGALDTWDETHLFLGGFVIISIGFAIVQCILKAAFWALKNLFPKHDIREL